MKFRGIALVTVLLVTALVSLLVVEMLQRHDVAIRKTSQLVHREQAWAHVDAGEAWARQRLIADGGTGDDLVDHLGEAWAAPFEPYPLEHGHLRVTIVDLQGRLNVNNLTALAEGDPPDEAVAADQAAAQRQNRPAKDNAREIGGNGASQALDGSNAGGRGVAAQQRAAGYHQHFSALLAALSLTDDLTSAVRDWIDPDQERSPPWGGEDPEYLLEDPPRRTADRPIVDPDELLAVRGFDVTTFLRLAPHLAALPESTRVNINTADELVLRALSGDAVSPFEAAEAVAAERRAAEPTDFFQEYLPSMLGREHLFQAYSSYFEVQVECQYHDQTVWQRTLLYRSPDSGRVEALARRQGPQEHWPFAGASGR